MIRCKRCILPETVPGLSINEEGLCNFCRDYQKIEYEGEDLLLEMIDKAKKKNMPYDCIVPVSGGRDSSFLLNYAWEKGLNSLAVNFDNDFATEQSTRNLKRACEITGTELRTARSPSGAAKKAVAASIRNVLGDGLESFASSFCSACGYGYRAVVFGAARELGVPLIFWGDSKIEKTSHMTAAGLSFRRGLQRKTLGKLSLQNLKSRWHLNTMRREFPSGRGVMGDLTQVDPSLDSPATLELRPFNYFGWDREKIKETIMGKLGWRKPDDAISTWRTDCKLEPLVSYAFKNIFGCDKSCFGYHNMINEGQMTREEALRQETHVTGDFTEELEHVLKNEIGLNDREIATIRAFSE